MNNEQDKISFGSVDRQELLTVAKEELETALSKKDYKTIESKLWKVLLLYQEETFRTAKGLSFTYRIKGNEIFISRKEKSVTRASVDMALKKALEHQENGVKITGPKMLKSFGASYLYPIFIEIGVVGKEFSSLL